MCFLSGLLLELHIIILDYFEHIVWKKQEKLKME